MSFGAVLRSLGVKELFLPIPDHFKQITDPEYYVAELDPHITAMGEQGKIISVTVTCDRVFCSSDRFAQIAIISALEQIPVARDQVFFGLNDLTISQVPAIDTLSRERVCCRAKFSVAVSIAADVERLDHISAHISPEMVRSAVVNEPKSEFGKVLAPFANKF
jgi:hypothetical protein